MTIQSKNRLKIAAAMFLAVAAFPSAAVAAEIDYARVVERSDSEILIKRYSFTKETYHRCTIATLACTEVPSDTKIAAPAPALPFMQAYRALMPAGAQSLLRSDDGAYVAFYIPATQSKPTRTFGIMKTADLSLYTKEEPVAYWDLLTEGIRYFVFSPDSKRLIYINDGAGPKTLYEADLTSLSNGTLESERLFSKNYEVADVIFKDNDSIFFIANRDNPYAWALYELNLSTYALKKIASDVSYDDNLRLIGLPGQGGKLLFHYADQSGVRPAVYNLATQKVEEFQLPAGNGTPSQGVKVATLKEGLYGTFLLESSGASDTLLVWLHGGPYRQNALGYHPYASYGGYDWMLENLRDANVGVLKLDYPGSAGFGREYAESITGKVGVIDSQKSYAAIKDFAARNGYKNIYVMGNSYGGYLALKLLVDYPSTFKGAFSVNGVADWLTLLTKLDTSIFNVQFLGTINDENRAAYQKSSIYNYVGNLGNQKVILMHGASDRTIPVSQSEGLATYLTANGKNVTLIKPEGEDHVYKKPETFETLCKTALSFVGRTTSACEL